MERLFFTLLWSAVVLSCGEGEVVDRPAAAAEFARLSCVKDPGNAPVVARVSGCAVTLEALEAFWHESPRLTRAQALDGVVEQQLLIMNLEGARLKTPALEDARARGLARALLQRLESQVAPSAKASPEDIKRLRREHRWPAGLRASQIVIIFPKELHKPYIQLTPEQKAQRDELSPKILATIQQVAQELGPTPTAEQMEAKAREVRKQRSDITFNAHLRFPLASEKGAHQTLPSGWMEVLPEFSKGASTSIQERGEGVLSEPVQSLYGWHIILPEAQYPAREPDPEEVEEEARRDAIKREVAKRLGGILERLMKRANLSFLPENLDSKKELSK